jgi:hypothetical protein
MRTLMMAGTSFFHHGLLSAFGMRPLAMLVDYDKTGLAWNRAQFASLLRKLRESIFNDFVLHWICVIGV